MSNYIFHQTNSGHLFLIEHNEMTINIGQMIEDHMYHRSQIIRLIREIANDLTSPDDDILFKTALYFDDYSPVIENVVQAYNKCFGQTISVDEVCKTIKYEDEH